MNNNKEFGNTGEEIAQKYLEQNEYKIILRNFYCKQGEIDIIAEDKEELVFIEVKSRNSNKFGKPKEAVTEIKKNHIYKAASYYIHMNNLYGKPIRLDVIEIKYFNNKYFINHIKKAIIEKP